MRIRDWSSDVCSSDLVRGLEKWVLLVSMTAVFFVLLALYAAVLAGLLPNQIQALDPANKASGLAVVFAITSIFSTLTTPIAGALSDRTRTRWGRRTPWIVTGRSEEHTSELQSLMRISYAVFCLKKKKLTRIRTAHKYKSK